MVAESEANEIAVHIQRSPIFSSIRLNVAKASVKRQITYATRATWLCQTESSAAHDIAQSINTPSRAP